jgi:hypothetical protein
MSSDFVVGLMAEAIKVTLLISAPVRPSLTGKRRYRHECPAPRLPVIADAC